MRIRNKYIKNEVYILHFAGDDIKDANQNVIASYADGDKVDVVMNFITGGLKYYVNGEYVGDGEVNFNADLTTYNYESYNGTTEINYLWQYNAGGTNDYVVEVWAGSLY